jgi:hypothetical protein
MRFDAHGVPSRRTGRTSKVASMSTRLYCKVQAPAEALIERVDANAGEQICRRQDKSRLRCGRPIKLIAG